MRALTGGVLAAACAVLVSAAPASAWSFKDSRFNARISGSYTTTGTVTNSRCWTEDADGNVTYFTASGQASETTTFRSTRSKVFEASWTRGERRLFAGGPAIPVTTTLKRSSTLDGSTEPHGCTPNGSRANDQPDCGTKVRSYKIALYGVGKGWGFSYNLSSGYSSTFPDDPFQACSLVDGDDWWGAYYSRGNGVAKVSRAKLFNHRLKRIVVHGTLDRTPKSTSSEWNAGSTETMRWTLTLVRRRGG